MTSNSVKQILLSFFYVSLMVSATAAYAQNYKLQNRIRVYTGPPHADSVVLSADNDLPIPVTLKANLVLTNLGTAGTAVVSAVIPAKTSGKSLAILYPLRKDALYKCDYSWTIDLGDTSKSPEADFPYAFPFLKGSGYKVSQAPYGTFSHKDMYAYDFSMPAGTPVCAARDGIVTLIKSDSDRGGPHKRYTVDANFISIYHTDGTLASYFHLGKNAVTVKEGQKVIKGQVIGYSGNTGFSDGPHLHFEITRANTDSTTKKWIKFQWEIPSDQILTMNPQAGK